MVGWRPVVAQIEELKGQQGARSAPDAARRRASRTANTELFEAPEIVGDALVGPGQGSLQERPEDELETCVQSPAGVFASNPP